MLLPPKRVRWAWSDQLQRRYTHTHTHTKQYLFSYPQLLWVIERWWFAVIDQQSLTILRKGFCESPTSYSFHPVGIRVDAKVRQMHPIFMKEVSIQQGIYPVRKMSCKNKSSCGVECLGKPTYRIYWRHKRTNVEVPRTGSILESSGHKHKNCWFEFLLWEWRPQKHNCAYVEQRKKSYQFQDQLATLHRIFESGEKHYCEKKHEKLGTAQVNSHYS